MKILVFGSLNIDLIFSVDHIVLPGETLSSGALEKSAGGKGANQAAALAKAGMDVYMAGKIGEDGKFLLELLRSYGVNTEYVKIYEGATGQAIIQLDKNGQNSIVLYAGGNGAITDDETDGVIGAFDAGDMILLQNEISCVSGIMVAAKKRGMKICLNPSPFDEKIKNLPMELVDVFFVNEIEGASLASLPPDTPAPLILDCLVKQYPAAEIILTLGKDGAVYGCGQDRAKGGIIDLPVLDTTGAGDTFTGYFIAARAKKKSPSGALALACKASSIAVSRMGAMEAIPFRGEVFPA
jgi:ribokinase